MDSAVKLLKLLDGAFRIFFYPLNLSVFTTMIQYAHIRTKE